MYVHAFGLTGVSPNTSACFASTCGCVTYFIQRYAQFGCGALVASIQVSAQPVAPSFGITAPIGKCCAMRVDAWYGQLVPTVTSPLAYAEICAGALLQYCLTSGCWALSRLTAAWNCGWVSSNGSV